MWRCWFAERAVSAVYYQYPRSTNAVTLIVPERHVQLFVFDRAGKPMRVHIGYEFVIESSVPTPIAALIQPRQSGTAVLLQEQYAFEPQLPLHCYTDTFGNRVWRWTAPAGTMRLRYSALAQVTHPRSGLPNLPGTPVDQLPDSHADVHIAKPLLPL